MEKAVKCTQNVLPDFVQVYSNNLKTQNTKLSRKLSQLLKSFARDLLLWMEDGPH